MTVDKSELRRLAETAADDIEFDWNGLNRASMHKALPPSAVLALLDELERLQATCDGLDRQNDAIAQEIGASESERVRLLAELEACRKDADRYRWLRGRCFGFGHDEAYRGIATMRWGEWHYGTAEGHAMQMDQAIDAAMSSEKEKDDE